MNRKVRYLLDGSFDGIFILIHTVLAAAQRRSTLQLATLRLLQAQTVRQLTTDACELAGRDQFAHLTLGIQRRAFHRLRTTKEQVGALRVKTTSECVDHSNLEGDDDLRRRFATTTTAARKAKRGKEFRLTRYRSGDEDN